VLAHRVSIMLEVDFRVVALPAPAARWKTPENVNTDHGSQFCSVEFVAEVQRIGARQCKDGRGCWRDNVFVERMCRSVKYEDVCLKVDDGVSRCSAKPQRANAGQGLLQRNATGAGCGVMRRTMST
jgi:putative transposase